MNTVWGLSSRDFYAGYKRIQGMPKTFYLEGQYLRTSSYSVIVDCGPYVDRFPGLPYPVNACNDREAIKTGGYSATGTPDVWRALMLLSIGKYNLYFIIFMT